MRRDQECLYAVKNCVTNTWKLKKVEVNCQDSTPTASVYALTMTLDDDETFTAASSIFSNSLNSKGNWMFNSDLILIDDTGMSTNAILRLTNKELKLHQIEDGDTTVNTFVARQFVLFNVQ